MGWPAGARWLTESKLGDDLTGLAPGRFLGDDVKRAFGDVHGGIRWRVPAGLGEDVQKF
jgi:hypothetical protein